MAVSFEALDAVPGFSVPVHRALTEPILLGGAPRSVEILNGTLAGAVGLGLQLWLAGILMALPLSIPLINLIIPLRLSSFTVWNPLCAAFMPI